MKEVKAPEKPMIYYYGICSVDHAAVQSIHNIAIDLGTGAGSRL